MCIRGAGQRPEPPLLVRLAVGESHTYTQCSLVKCILSFNTLTTQDGLSGDNFIVRRGAACLGLPTAVGARGRAGPGRTREREEKDEQGLDLDGAERAAQAEGVAQAGKCGTWARTTNTSNTLVGAVPGPSRQAEEMGL